MYQPLSNYLHKTFLMKFQNSGFVIQSKALVLMWIHVIFTPVIFTYFLLNLTRPKFGGQAAVLIIDSIFFLTLIAGLYFLRKGWYFAVVNTDIAIVFLLTIGGHLSKYHAHILTAHNNFSPLIFGTLILAAMFGKKKVLVIIAATFVVFQMVLYFFVMQEVKPDFQQYLLSGSLNLIFGIIIVFALTLLNSIITDKALSIAESELEKNIEHVNTLKGLLPICANCKKIRDDNGYWNQIEQYISEHSDAEFSHGICPDCVKELYPDFCDDENFIP